ncbi:MAG: flavin reductase family protein [Oscillospiraceae bacterium]|nr:flavin reductase family protein [Oscillospiraceae bacterium]
MKKHIKVWDYAGRIAEELEKGVLLTTKSGDKVNSMTIGWGLLGIQWAKPVFVVLVRESRHTKKMLEENPEFTINIPLGAIDKSILGVCGTKSGRDMDKIAALGLTLEEGETVSVPAIKELPLTLECKVIYKQDQDPKAIAPEYDARFYAKGTANEGDYHTAYYGEITAAYIVE